MLLKRSISLKVYLLLTITQCYCQSYDYGAEESDEPSYQEDGDHPDYSKFYSTDTSAPLVTSGDTGESGFSSPIEFSGFFSPIEFGASQKNEKVKNPFVKPDSQINGFVDAKQAFPQFESSSNFPKDYFEAAQQKEQQGQDNRPESYGVSPGPSYISHEITPEYSSGDDHSADEYQAKYKKPKNNDKSYQYETSSQYSKKYKTPDYKYEYNSDPSHADYTVGKSSSTVSQYPKAAGHYKAVTPSPYEKYSFQPVQDDGFKSKYLGSLISTVAPFNPAYSKIASTIATPTFESQPSEQIPSHLQGKNCKRVKKHIEETGRAKREAVNCFVCEDPGTSSKFTQCSYTAEDEPINYSEGSSERYSVPSKSTDGFRYKRYSGDEYSDPYEYVKARSQASYKQPKENQEDDYGFVGYYDDAPDKSFSEIQAEQIKTDPAHCHKETKSGMTCTICKDPKTGGNYEQCSYTSEPKEQKYAYVTERKYDSENPEVSSESKPISQTQDAKSKSIKEQVENFKPKEEYNQYHAPYQTKKLTEPSNKQFVDNYQPKGEYTKYRAPYTEPKKNEGASSKEFEDNFKPTEEYIKHRELYKTSKTLPEAVKKREHENFNPREEFEKRLESYNKPTKKLINDEPYDIPKHFAESTSNNKKAEIRGLDSSLYGSGDSSEAAEAASTPEEAHPYKDLDEYHFKLFPEYSHQESKQQQVLANNPVDTSRKDVEEVLAEFTKKDRSACKKAEKNGMTCYLCVDEKGIQHEECMYVSESKPQATHVAYHEVQQIKKPENGKAQLHRRAAPFEPSTAPSDIKRKRFFKKVTTESPFALVEAASEEIESKILSTKKPIKSKRRSTKKQKQFKEPASSSSDVTDRLSEDEDEPTQQTPVEFEVGAEEGAFSAETKPVYSKKLGVRLPKYMLEKSEFEKEFDDFAYNP